MAGADAARTSLDTRAATGDAADRPYVTSMLRRLGYSDAQIADYLAGKPLNRGPALSNPPRSTEAADRRASRDIEVEYTGPGLREYRLVIPKSLAFGEVAGAALDFVEVDAPTEEDAPAEAVWTEVPDDFPGWEQDGWRLYREADATGVDPIAEHGFARVGAPIRDGMVPAYVPDGHEVVFDEASGEPRLQAIASAWPEAPADAFPGWEQDGWRLYKSTKSTNPNPIKTHRFARADEKAPRNTEPAHVPDGHEVAWDAGGKPRLVKRATAVSTSTPADAVRDDGWQLYSKDEGEGPEAQRIFFFSKEAPDDAAPAEVPEGYEVAVNPETGRPFLRKMRDEEPDTSPIDSANPGVDPAQTGRKRVRIVRVRAADRNAAQRKMEREGRNVLATMPIDIEKKVR